MATQTQTKQTAKHAAKANTTKRTSGRLTSVPVHERDPKVIAVDTAYVFAGLANNAAQLAGEAVTAARTLPGRIRSTDAKRTRTDLEKRVRDLRNRLESRFDEKAAEGRTLADDLLKDRRVRNVVDQAGNARSQVKAAVTSVRRTARRSVEAGAAAGRDQAQTARSQTKAAVTSVQKTADAVVEAVTGSKTDEQDS
ncbi:MAG: hypothetical protein M3N57_11110 [Actinomycetota bacterium]|nr:hypothetical protein [Actinomycetota bacterium]